MIQPNRLLLNVQKPRRWGGWVGEIKGGGEEKINSNQQNKVAEGEREAPGRRGERARPLNGWKTLNENDPAEGRRLSGWNPCSLGTRALVCLLVFHGYPAVRIMAGVKRWTIFPNRSSAAPVGHNSLNNCFGRAPPVCACVNGGQALACLSSQLDTHK